MSARSREDNRPTIRENAWRAVDLNWRAKAYLVRVTDLPAETDDDGRRRRGSKAMDARGHFSLRREYIALMLGTDPAGVKRAQQECVSKGYLSEVWRGRHGLPSQLQALLYRGAEKGGHRGSETDPLYDAPEAADQAHRGAETDPLSLKTPDQPAHAPEPCGIEPAPGESQAAKSRDVDPSASWRHVDPEQDERNSA